MQLYPDYYYDFRLQPGELEKSLTQTQVLAFTLLEDIIGRRGFRQEFDGFGQDIQNEVINDWIQIIEKNDNPQEVVHLIISDMEQRSGWNSICDDVDDDVLEEMKQTLAEKFIVAQDSFKSK